MIPHYRSRNRQNTRIVSIAGHKEEKLLHYSLKANLGRLTWVRPQQPLEQRYPYLLECAVFQRVRANNGIAALKDSYRAHTLR